MAFNLVRISQQDPRWKKDQLGKSNYTLGSSGCAVTSVAMLLSGFGYPETTGSLNQKLKSSGGFVGAAIVWGAVSAIHPQVRYKNLVICNNADAPIDAIANSIAAGQPVLLEVDSSPSPGLQTHWVVAYKKVGKDFYILDPWPYPTEEGKDVSLMSRYSHGKELKNAISAVVFYECTKTGSGESVSTPSSTPATPLTGYLLRVKDSASAGVRIRSAPNTNSDTLSIEPAGSTLKVIESEAGARQKIGVEGQWVQVRTADGVEGYTAAWLVENASAQTGTSTSGTTTTSTSGTTPSSSAPTPLALIEAVNAFRTSKGLTAFKTSTILNGIAQAHASWMSSSGQVQHVDANGKRPFQRALDAGYPLAGNVSAGGFCAENIFAGQQSTIQDAMSMWQGDDAHLNTMLSPNLTEIGAGIAVSGDIITYCIDTAQPTAGANTSPTPAPQITLTPLGREVANVALEPPVQMPIKANYNGNQRLVAGIWNRFGGLLNALAKSLNVELGAAVATLAVESGGQGFAADGRMIIRFENHIFWGYWGKNNQSKFNQHFKYDSGQTWQGHQWRPNANQDWRDFHGNQSAEWEIFNFARSLDDTAAKYSISMGSPQIMGFNYSMIGYASVSDMFKAFSSGDRGQIVGLFDYIKNRSGALSALRNKNYVQFALNYNGSGQEQTYGNLIRTNADVFNDLYKDIAEKVSSAPATPATPPVEPPTENPPAESGTPATNPPSETTSPSTSTPSTSTSSTGSQPPEPKPEITIYVANYVGAAGIKIYKRPDSTSPMLASAFPRDALTSLEEASTLKNRLGVDGKWLNVRAKGGIEGYVGAQFVKMTQDLAPAPSTTTTPASTPSTTSTTPASTTPSQSADLFVYVANYVGTGGIKIRKSPNETSAIVGSAFPRDALMSLDDTDVTKRRVGLEGKWINVRAKGGIEGYVGAWLVKLTQDPAPAPATPATPAGAKLVVNVLPAVGSGGLRMRSQPSVVAAVVTTVFAGSKLTVLDAADKARAAIGQNGSWLQVQDDSGKAGYVAAWFVAEDKSAASSASLSFDVSDFTDLAPAAYMVRISGLAGKGGVRLRESPNVMGVVIDSLAPGTELEVLEPADEAERKVGVFNEWLKVKDPQSREGYIAAWFLEH